MSDANEPKIDFSFTRTADKGHLTEPTFSGALSFARRRYTKDVANADVAVVGIPFDLATTSRPGARLGPRGVREASTMIAWDRVHEWPYDPFDKIAVVDYGDVHIDAGVPQDVPAAITDQFRVIHNAGVKTLMLGGDHFVTYPVLQSLAPRFDQPLSLIHFDAHSDTWAEDKKTICHGTMFYHAAREGLVAPERSVQVGIRTFNKDDHGFNILSAEAANDIGAQGVVARIRKIVGDAPVYITFDIDCLDPSMAPGTGTPVVGGMTSMDAQRILRGLQGLNVVGADVVEVAPAYDVSQITSLAAATLAMNMVGLFAACAVPSDRASDSL
ncbi:MAG: agmatinase [Gammaproteobacteria bacterium]